MREWECERGESEWEREREEGERVWSCERERETFTFTARDQTGVYKVYKFK